jgi:LysM repeat protein
MPSAAVLARASSGAAVQTVAEQATESDDDVPEPSSVVHRVKSGDTLFGLARRYHTTVEKLKALNRLAGNSLKVGTRLVISAARAANAQQQ